MDVTPIKRKPGHQSAYTHELAQRICQALENGQSLNAICQQPGMPPEGTVREWARKNVSGFAASYACARSAGIDALAERTLAIAGDRTRDPNCRRVEVDAIKWFASKLRPDVYGDLNKVELAGAGGAPLSVEIKFVAPEPVSKDKPQARPVKQLNSANAT